MIYWLISHVCLWPVTMVTVYSWSDHTTIVHILAWKVSDKSIKLGYFNQTGGINYKVCNHPVTLRNEAWLPRSNISLLLISHITDISHTKQIQSGWTIYNMYQWSIVPLYKHHQSICILLSFLSKNEVAVSFQISDMGSPFMTALVPPIPKFVSKTAEPMPDQFVKSHML